MKNVLRENCRIPRVMIWRLFFTTFLLGTINVIGQKTRVKIFEGNSNRFSRLLARAEPNTVFVLSTDVELTSTAAIRSVNVTIRGNSPDGRSVVRCAESANTAFRVRLGGVKFANLDIRDCSGTAVSVSIVDENPDPFANQGSSGRTDPTPLRVEFRNVRFADNGAQDARSAGAIFIGRSVTAKIIRCNFVNNTAVRGGAIHSQGTALQINNSVFSNNIAVNSGGAVSGSAHLRDHEQERRVSIHGTQFLENRVFQGGQDPNPLRMRSSDVNMEANQNLKFPRPTLSGGALSLADFTSITVINSEFKGNSAVPAGGAIYLSDNGKTELQNCTFRNNSVGRGEQQRNDAQRLQMGGAMFVVSRDGSSQLNIKVSRFENNSAVFGGALHIVAAVSSRIIVTGTNFTNNSARQGGGAIVFRNMNYPRISSCEFVGNSAFIGGALFVTNGAGLQVERSRGRPSSSFKNNIAFDGGAIFGIGTGAVKFADSEFTRNQAYRDGGAICVVDSKLGGEFILQDSRFRNNTAEKGGALFLENTERVEILASSDEEDSVQPLIHELSNGVNTFSNNAAVAGGAVYYRAASPVRNTLTLNASRFVNNKVYPSIFAIYPEPLNYPERDEEALGDFGRRIMHKSQNEDPSSESLLDPLGTEPCYPGGGGAVCFVLNRLWQRVPVTIQLHNCSLERNLASVGGGLFFSTEERTGWAPDCHGVNGICRILKLSNLNFVNNSARFAGGGVFASNLTHLFYSAAETEDSNVSYLPLLDSHYRAELTNNSVENGGYGPNIASMAVSLHIAYPVSDHKTGFLINNHSSGQSNPLPTIGIEILDELSQVVSAGIEDSSLRVRANADLHEILIMSGQIDAVAEAGVANFSALAILAPAGPYELEFEPPKQSITRITSIVEIRACLLGEVNKTEDLICEKCDVEFFSFHTERKCDACPAHARCTGGASIVPLPHYWHSSPFSTVMIECFNREACNYKKRTVKLEYQHNVSRQEFFDRLRNKGNDSMFSNEEYSQCAEGYEGPLCGSCENGYGRTDSKTCRECGSRGVTSVVVFGLTIWQLVFACITLRSALVSIKDMNQMLLLAGNNSTAFATPAGTNRDPGTNAGAQDMAHLRDILNDSETAGMTLEQLHETYVEFRDQDATQVNNLPTSVAATPQRMLIESIIAIQHASETIKILVNFLQMTSVAISINVDWTETVRKMLEAMNSIAGVSRGASFAPLTCLFDNNVDYRSIYGEILRFSIHLGIILFFVIYYFIRWFIMRRQSHSTPYECMNFLKSRVIISFLVVMFFSYQSLSEEFMGMVGCIELDSDEINNDTLYPEYSIARDWYWTVDTNIRCFERRHAFLAGFLGIPGIIFILFGVPFSLLCFLLYKRAKENLLDLDMVNTYGFIYRNYRKRFVFWEVCILGRKALIGAVAVFAYPWGSNLQGVMASGILILALWMHLTAAPFKYDILNMLEGCSLLVSIFTFYSGIIFNDENTTHTGRVFLSAVLVLINVVLALTLLVFVVHYVDKLAVAKLKTLGVQDIPRNFILRSWTLANVVSGKALTTVKDTLRNRLSGSQVEGNGNQTTITTRKSNAYQSLTSQAPSQYSHAVQEGNNQSENTIELPQVTLHE